MTHPICQKFSYKFFRLIFSNFLPILCGVTNMMVS